jgi:O-antigen ligase
MSPMVPITMFGWIPVVFCLFALLPSRKAVVWSYMLAWLFLPMAGYHVSGLPDYTKTSAATFGVLLGAAVFDAQRLLSFRPRLWDVPILTYCAAPFFSSVTNGLGAYDGASAVLEHMVYWGLPYFVGRVYLNDFEGLRELAVAVFYGGLLYVPLCLYEIRMSPQLHIMVYGFHQHSFAQTIRMGGWRPTVFMQHGLMVGMWMTTASLIGVWLWVSGAVRRVWGFPISWVVLVLLATTVLCKSLGSLGLLVIGLGVLFATKWFRRSLFIWCIFLVPVAYVVVQMTYQWDGEPAVSLIAKYVDPDRAQSLQHRLEKEVVFVNHALERPLFGWGGWGRMKPIDPESLGRKKIKLLGVDGLWYQSLGTNGLVGLISMDTMMLLPVFIFASRYKGKYWLNRALAPAAASAMVVALFMWDSLLNAMINPMYLLASGALLGVVLTWKRGAWRVAVGGREPMQRRYGVVRRGRGAARRRVPVGV